MATSNTHGFCKVLESTLLGLVSGLAGGYLLSSTVEAGRGDLFGPPTKDAVEKESQSFNKLIIFLTMWIGFLLMVLIPIKVLQWVKAAFRRTEPDATQATVFLIGTTAVCGGLGHVMETAVGRLSHIQVVYKYTVDTSVTLAFLVAALYVAGCAVVVSAPVGMGPMKRGAVAAGGGAILTVILKCQSVVGQWGTLGALLGPAGAAGVALSAGLTCSCSTYGVAESSSTYVWAGRAGTTLGTLCAAWFGTGALGGVTVFIHMWISCFFSASVPVELLVW
ncbi:uncharacterized protein LOC129846523 [Salvelinus fontinalis]|uniref:uncharacterized protein LOC129846523 n=1 Tax=Salvelinus fontinalis TaxID=8038 RepID=UPI002486CB94|nr:uncharacterized protein LOC129846523 [Salvelinus fontinalis]